jgi:hypothetical protein
VDTFSQKAQRVFERAENPEPERRIGWAMAVAVASLESKADHQSSGKSGGVDEALWDF